jgi:hypothetical protein
MNTEQVRESLRAVAEHTDVPVVDQVAFRAAARRARRRRTAPRAVLGVAASLAVAATAVGVMVTLGGGRPAAPAGPGPVVDVGAVLDAPVYLVREGRVVALDPDGRTHDLGLASEGVVGFNARTAIVLDRESHLVRFVARRSAGAGWSFRRVAAPTEEPVDRVVMSGDGRLLAWVGLDQRLTTLDLDTGRRTARQLRHDEQLIDVSGSEMLLGAAPRRLVVSGGGTDLQVPLRGDGYGFASTIAGHLVAVVDRDNRTRVYEISSGRPRRIATVPGSGSLSPDGDAVVGIRSGSSDRTTGVVWDRVHGTRVLTGISGRLESAAWADDDTVLATVSAGRGTTLWACGTRDGRCGRLPVEGADMTLSG